MGQDGGPGCPEGQDTSVGCSSRWFCNPGLLKYPTISYNYRTVQWESVLQFLSVLM